jgi:hypothetical protein
VVETVGLELWTHHPVVELVSIRAGNGIFQCRDSRANTATVRPRDPNGDSLDEQKPAVTRTKCGYSCKGPNPETGWWCAQSRANQSPLNISLLSGNLTGISAIFRPSRRLLHRRSGCAARVFDKFPKTINRVKLSDNRDRIRTSWEIQSGYQEASVPRPTRDVSARKVLVRRPSEMLDRVSICG